MYLFVRAMVGERTPPGCGVFSWDPPAALVVALSDLLAAPMNSMTTLRPALTGVPGGRCSRAGRRAYRRAVCRLAGETDERVLLARGVGGAGAAARVGVPGVEPVSRCRRR